MESTETLLTLTAAAVSKVEIFLEEHGSVEGSGLRVAVWPEAEDEVLDLSGIRVFVDAFSVQYLDGVEIDYVTNMMGSGFTFQNPNATGGCGCGSSFTA